MWILIFDSYYYFNLTSTSNSYLITDEADKHALQAASTVELIDLLLRFA